MFEAKLYSGNIVMSKVLGETKIIMLANAHRAANPNTTMISFCEIKDNQQEERIYRAAFNEGY